MLGVAYPAHPDQELPLALLDRGLPLAQPDLALRQFCLPPLIDHLRLLLQQHRQQMWKFTSLREVFLVAKPGILRLSSARLFLLSG